MEKSNFFALLRRMKTIDRWGLMHSARRENLAEHTLETALIAHALAAIRQDVLRGEIDTEAVLVAALYHDASEILTGDLPTPVKYFSEGIRTAYREVERSAEHRLQSMIPAEIRPRYAGAFAPGDDVKLLVKAADKISALMKCIEEEQLGNREFTLAKEAQLKALRAFPLPEVQVFLDSFLDGCGKTLDEINA